MFLCFDSISLLIFAPGHGEEDFVTGLKYGLPMVSPVDDDGKFTEDTGRFSGLHVLGDGNGAVVTFKLLG